MTLSPTTIIAAEQIRTQVPLGRFRAIIEEVSDHSGVSVEAILGRSQRADHVRAQKLARLRIETA